MAHEKRKRSKNKPNILSISRSQKGRKPRAKAPRRTRGRYTG